MYLILFSGGGEISFCGAEPDGIGVCADKNKSWPRPKALHEVSVSLNPEPGTHPLVLHPRIAVGSKLTCTAPEALNRASSSNYTGKFAISLVDRFKRVVVSREPIFSESHVWVGYAVEWDGVVGGYADSV